MEKNAEYFSVQNRLERRAFEFNWAEQIGKPIAIDMINPKSVSKSLKLCPYK